jgi:hypothetical protein
MSQLATLGGLVHPEWVAWRRLWIDSLMQDLIFKVQHGDPTKGWEGDPQLCVYATESPQGISWELVRLEEDNEYRLVARSKPGVVFDERIIEMLVARDVRRNPKFDLGQSVIDHNEKIDEGRAQTQDDYMSEEVVPRLRHAFRKDGL